MRNSGKRMIANIVATDQSLSIRITSAEALQYADQAAQGLEVLVQVRQLANEYQWVNSLAGWAVSEDQEHPSFVALRSFAFDASTSVEEYARYLQRPVESGWCRVTASRKIQGPAMARSSHRRISVMSSQSNPASVVFRGAALALTILFFAVADGSAQNATKQDSHQFVRWQAGTDSVPRFL
jgi:hypothetical protein